jgi:hypothetical protein
MGQLLSFPVSYGGMRTVEPTFLRRVAEILDAEARHATAKPGNAATQQRNQRRAKTQTAGAAGAMIVSIGAAIQKRFSGHALPLAA